MRQLRVVVSGMLAADPGQGGASWAVLQYLLGLERLGHDVHLVEPLHPGRACSPKVASYFLATTSSLAIAGRATLLSGSATIGLPYDELRAYCSSSDVLLNFNGMLRDPSLVTPVRRRVYVDLDPAFVQLWHSEGIDMGLDGHTHFVTVGQAIGTPGCSIPTCGHTWLRTLPPVVLDRWSVADNPPATDALTTVANWRSYGSVAHEGQMLGQKAHSLRALWDVPIRTGHRFRLALRIDDAEVNDLDLLRRGGWELVDPDEVAGTPAAYRQFVQTSLGEFGLTKSGYVLSRSGWFSDRSACYLASGRPVIAHATGFEEALPVGEGLLVFSDADGVVQAVDELRRDYRSHARAARRLAERFFDSDHVLQALLASVEAI